VLQRNGHVRVDIFYQKFSGRRQALVEIFGNLLFLLPVALFLIAPIAIILRRPRKEAVK
jgi:TRAP-type mannitol/chloroaromatic compound transport system permease small subunit